MDTAGFPDRGSLSRSDVLKLSWLEIMKAVRHRDIAAGHRPALRFTAITQIKNALLCMLLRVHSWFKTKTL